MFKDYLVENKYLTKEQIQEVEKEIAKYKSLGYNKKFLEVCRHKHMFVEKEMKEVKDKSQHSKLIDKNENICAQLLALTTSKEVLSKVVIMSHIENIKKYNVDLKKLVKDYFILAIDEDNKIIEVCKDLSNEPEYYQLEKLFVGYSIIKHNVVEGVTAEILGILGGK